MRRNVLGIALCAAIVITSVYVADVLVRYRETVELLQHTGIPTDEIIQPLGDGNVVDVDVTQAVFDPSSGIFEIQLKSKSSDIIEGGSVVEIELRKDTDPKERVRQQLLMISPDDLSIDGKTAKLRFRMSEEQKFSRTSNLFIRIRSEVPTIKANRLMSSAEFKPVLLKHNF